MLYGLRDLKTLNELKYIQQEISQRKSQLVRLETLDFPILFSVLATIILSADRLPSNRFRAAVVDKEEMEIALRILKDEMQHKGVTSSNFDVDQFCKEIRSYINNEEEMKYLSKQIAELEAKERQLKESLKII